MDTVIAHKYMQIALAIRIAIFIDCIVIHVIR